MRASSAFDLRQVRLTQAASQFLGQGPGQLQLGHLPVHAPEGAFDQAEVAEFFSQFHITISNYNIAICNVKNSICFVIRSLMRAPLAVPSPRNAGHVRGSAWLGASGPILRTAFSQRCRAEWCGGGAAAGTGYLSRLKAPGYKGPGFGSVTIDSGGRALSPTQGVVTVVARNFSSSCRITGSCS